MRQIAVRHLRTRAATHAALQFGGAALGVAVVLAYGEALAQGVRDVWTGAVLPAFFELGASGLPLCG